jgi:micrococcal nuclease
MKFLRRKQTQKLLFSLLLSLVILLISTHTDWLKQPVKTVEQNQPGFYTVLKADDGDTIVVDMNGTKETVRFIGVDTPETHDPRKAVQCYGKEASDHTKAALEGKQVRLEADPLDTNRDRYGRLLRYIYLPNGDLYQEELLNQGFALAYTAFPFQKANGFTKLEAAAKSANKGLWASCQIITESNGARHTNPL